MVTALNVRNFGESCLKYRLFHQFPLIEAIRILRSSYEMCSSIHEGYHSTLSVNTWNSQWNPNITSNSQWNPNTSLNPNPQPVKATGRHARIWGMESWYPNNLGLVFSFLSLDIPSMSCCPRDRTKSSWSLVGCSTGAPILSISFEFYVTSLHSLYINKQKPPIPIPHILMILLSKENTSPFRIKKWRREEYRLYFP